MPTLDDRCRDQLVPEPITFVVGADGRPRFKSPDALPSRALIDMRGGIIFGVNMASDPYEGWVTLEDADGRSVTYTRCGVTLGGAWICDLKR